jgi:hypothetical protein
MARAESAWSQGEPAQPHSAAAQRLPACTAPDLAAPPARRAAPTLPGGARRCIPVRFKPGVEGPPGAEVLMITSRNGKGYVFPKVRICGCSP